MIGCVLRAAGSAAGWALARAGLSWELSMPTNEELDEMLADFVAGLPIPTEEDHR